MKTRRGPRRPAARPCCAVWIEGPLPLAELSEKLDLTRSTTHRLASALVERRLLSFRPREGYSLGPKLLELGHAASQQMHLPRVARPWLEQLSAATDDTVHLGVLDGRHALYLDKVAGRRRINIGSRLGERHPIASTGLGKALLLDEDEATWERLYVEAKGGEPSRKQIDAYIAEMRVHKARGEVLHDSELGDGVRSIAVPVRDAKGQICVAISIASAAHYLTDDVRPALAEQVMKSAEQISAAVGFSGQR